MFGFPTGVGCLIARKEALAKLIRPWFAGGTISLVSVQGRGWHQLLRDHAGFEDGTVNYLSLAGIEIGLRHLERVGIDRIHERVRCLTGWLLQEMSALRHANGQSAARIFGPDCLDRRGGTIAFVLLDSNGKPHDFRDIEALAAERLISLRTGCFCNPGAGEAAHGLTAEHMRPYFEGGENCSFGDFYIRSQAAGLSPSTLRVSVGIASNFADVDRFARFARTFLDASQEAVTSTASARSERHALADTA
jgi:selenocysteine lyase/cysteine desulfurase